MLLRILDEETLHEATYKNPQHIPRKGDSIDWFWGGNPVAKRITFNYAADEILIVLLFEGE
jgi:hypothetical protein